VNPLMNKVVIPIECIRRINKAQNTVLQAMMFEVYVDCDKPPTMKLHDGSVLGSVLPVPLQKKYKFRSTSWQSLFSTIARQAQVLHHKLMISVKGKDDVALQLGVSYSLTK